MASRQFLEERVQKAQAQIEKKQNTITKKENLISKKKNQIEKLGFEPEKIAADRYNDSEDHDKAIGLAWDIDTLNDDLKRLHEEVEEIQKRLDGYQNDLKVTLEKEASRNVKVILDFLQMWKDRCHEYYMTAMVEFSESYNEIHKLYEEQEKCRYGSPEWKEANDKLKAKQEEHHKNLHGVYENKMVTEFVYNYRTRKHEEKQVEKSVKVEDGKWEYADAYLDRNLADGEARLNKDLQTEADRKYDFIIERTNAIVGQITDASCLKIGAKQDLNGYVIGAKGKARVQTIGAGGYNIQCFHFRTLINPMK